MGLLDILRGVADQADFIPGFDPNKDRQGLLSQLFSGGAQTPPIVQPGTVPQSNNAPGGASPQGVSSIQRYKSRLENPYHKYAEPQSYLGRMFTPMSQKAMYNQGHMKYLEHKSNAAQAKQAAEVAQQKRAALMQQGKAAGLQGADLLAYMSNPQEFGKSYGSNFAAHLIGEGDELHRYGQDVVKNDRTAPPLDPMDAQLRQQNADASTMQADAAMLRARNPSPGVVVNTGDTAAGQRPIVDKPEKGYQMTWDADAGTYRQEVVPGSSQAREEEMLNSKAFQALQANNEQFGAIMSNIDAADELIGTFTAGAGSYLEGIRGTPAKDLAARMETVKANIGFDKLNEMRQTSPTGGALGQVTERELNFLQSVRGSLDSGQSPEQLRETLNEVKASLQRLQEVREIAFKLEQQSPGEGQIASSDPFTNDDLPPGFEIVQ
jgi:hypothetical protein